jgi:putative salt-induced outer membrane protein
VGGVLVETETQDVSAETYSANTKYRYTVHEALFWYVSAGWLRNRPSGIENREYGGAGLGYRFVKTDKDTLLGELGADYTYEEDVDSPDPKKGFPGAREFVSWEHILSPTAKFSTDLEALENLEDSDDYRLKSVTAIVASLTSKLALKVSYTVLYDHQPVVDVLTAPTFPDVFFEHETTDTVFSAALVVNF